jgi:hypothetical protein
MSLKRFREPQFQGAIGNRWEPRNRVVLSALFIGRFLVPGTIGNRPAHSGSRNPPPKGGNRDQCQLSGMPR